MHPTVSYPSIWQPATVALVVLGMHVAPSGLAREPDPKRAHVDRSPVDLAISPDGRQLVTANRTSHTLSLVEIKTGAVLDEAACGQEPAAVAFSPDGSQILATASESGELIAFALDDERLIQKGAVHLGFGPRGLALSSDGGTAYVALEEAAAVAVVDLDSMTGVRKIEVGRWPRYLALSPDDSRLAVGISGDRGVAVLDAAEGTVLYREVFSALNLGHMQIDRNNRFVYVPWVAYGSNPITAQNIRRGWVIASRVARVRLDGPARREAIALDQRGEAVGDPHGLALSPDERWLVVTASGSHELLVFQIAGLPFQAHGGPGDTIDDALAADASRFFRIPLGGRPMAARFARDGARVFVANYLGNAIQVVDLGQHAVVQTIELGSADEPSLARKGEAIFYDARRSLDQWYSCHTCHYEGGVNAVKMDTTNDGGFGSFKTVLDLHNVTETGPWTWHGWQTDFRSALSKSLTETMLGPQPTDDDLDALAAYLASLKSRASPFRNRDGSLAEAAARGKKLFESGRAGCRDCHRGAYFTDGQIHDVGLGQASDRYQGLNTPSLIGVHRRVKLLHDGRCDSLEEVLRGPHRPEAVNGAQLTDLEIADLAAYLRSL
jgi:DNA-binding beta-propeller fold protein YncE